MLARVVVLLIGGCGRWGFGGMPDAGAHGDGGAADVARDGPPDAACTWGAFSAPVRLAGPINSSTDDWGPAISRDGTEIYFHSFRGASGTADLWHASRASIAVDFSAPTMIAALSTTTFQEASPTTSDAGLLIVFASTATGMR